MFIFTVESSLLDQLLHETDTDAVRREGGKREAPCILLLYYYIESLFICFKAQ